MYENSIPKFLLLLYSQEVWLLFYANRCKKQFLVQLLWIGLTVEIVKVKIEITTISFNFKKTFKLHLPQKHFRSKKQHCDLSFCQFFSQPSAKNTTNNAHSLYILDKLTLIEIKFLTHTSDV